MTNFPTSLATACTCGALEVVSAPTDTVHHARWNCIACGKFRGWQQSPENVTKRQTQDQLIDQLLLSDGVNGWERMFLKSLKATKKRSGKQAQKLAQIASRLGIAEEVGA